MRGFTLIELLVFIAMIVILAAILFPVFARARENARRTSCASNLKQIGLGVMQYTQDYDEAYPNFNFFVNADNVRVDWSLAIQRYVKNMQLFVCPSDTFSTVFPDLPGYGTNVRRSYALANYLRVWESNVCNTGQTDAGKMVGQ